MDIDISPSPLRLSLKRKPCPRFKFDELYPNSDVDNYSDNSIDENDSICNSKFKRIKKAFKKLKNTAKIPRLLSNDFNGQSSEEKINSSLREKSVFHSRENNMSKNYNNEEDEYYLESYCEDDYESYDILSLLERNKRK